MARQRYGVDRYTNPIKFDKRGHQILKIAYGAVPNTNKMRGPHDGFSPVVWFNGTPHDSGWSARGLDRETACLVAKTQALDEADHYTGDWVIKVISGCARGTQKDLTHGLKRVKPKAKTKAKR